MRVSRTVLRGAGGEVSLVYSPFEIAKSQNKIIIPIGSTGYMSKKILDLIEKDIKNFKYLKDYLTILKLEKDYKKIVSIIAEILNKKKLVFNSCYFKRIFSNNFK